VLAGSLDKHFVELSAGVNGKITRPSLDATDQMGDQVVWAFLFRALLFLLGKHADRISYHFGLGLPPLSRQPPDQRFGPCV
jgi:hypothetical protein